MQPLLVPVVFTAEPLEIAAAEDERETLSTLGFDVSPASPTTLTVRGVPAMLQDADARELARDVLARAERIRREPRADRAPQRAPRHDGLPRRRAREPAPLGAGNERACFATWNAPSAPVSATTAGRRGARSRWRSWIACSCGGVEDREA
jgi:hypothetical protein